MRVPARFAILAVVGALPMYSPRARQEPSCQMKVVSCNYAYLYSGQFSWTNVIKSSESNLNEQVTVGVNKGAANCLGTVVETEHGRSTTRTISGPGLFAVEFERDSANKLVYRITAACPTAAGEGSPAQKAELGHNDRESYQQKATSIGQDVLEGGSSYPAPETDPSNGVTGTVKVSWRLTKKIASGVLEGRRIADPAFYASRTASL